MLCVSGGRARGSAPRAPDFQGWAVFASPIAPAPTPAPPPSTPKSQNRARKHAPPSKFPRISPLRHYSLNPHVHSCIPPQYPSCSESRARLSGVGRRLLADTTCADTCAPQAPRFQHRQIWTRSARQDCFVKIALKQVQIAPKARIARQFGGRWQDRAAVQGWGVASSLTPAHPHRELLTTYSSKF